MAKNQRRTDPSDNGLTDQQHGSTSAPGDRLFPSLDEADGDTTFNPAELETQSPPVADVIDPYDPDTYKVSQNLAAAAGIKKHLTELTVTTPNAAWWVRRHPDPTFMRSTNVIELKEEREQYLVLPHLWPGLVGEATFKAKSFYLATTMQGKLFLWSIRRPVDDTKEPEKWMRAPLEAVRLAKDQWVRISWNQNTKQHDVVTCASQQQPEWPDLPMPALLKLAFADHVIDKLDHPVLKRLRGESK